MKKNMIMIFFVIITILMASSFAQNVLDKIVAIVGDDIILDSELVQAAWMLGGQLGVDVAKDSKALGELKEKALENFINKKLMLIQAEKDPFYKYGSRIKCIFCQLTIP